MVRLTAPADVPATLPAVVVTERLRLPLWSAEEAADLIVLTAPRFDPAAPGAGWGSMSYRIGILSQCPVLLVK